MPIELVMPSSHHILCRPHLLLPPIPPSIRVFSNESTFHMRWPKYWSFSFSISLSNEHPGLISFRMDWLVYKDAYKLTSICKYYCVNCFLWFIFEETTINGWMPSSHLILGRPLLLLPPIPPSVRVFSSESTLRVR